jgi:hypothetical protein
MLDNFPAFKIGKFSSFKKLENFPALKAGFFSSFKNGTFFQFLMWNIF